MPGLRLTKQAQEDLRDIGRYTQRMWGREQRNRYLTQIDAALHLIARNPHIGRACDAIRPGYRKYPVGRHIIFYRVTSDAIAIIRILHERMDVDTHLSET